MPTLPATAAAGTLPTGPQASLCILVHDLSATGVVRNALALSAHFARQMPVELVTVHRGGVLSSQVDPRVRLIELEGPGIIGRAMAMRRHLRRSGPALLLSAGNRSHLLAWSASFGLGRLRRVYRLSNSIRHARAGQGTLKRLRGLGRWLTLSLISRQADVLIANSPSLAREIGNDPRTAGKLRVISNGVDVEMVRSRAAAHSTPLPRRDPRVPLALSIGRLVEQKNYETLIEALGVANRSQPLDLVILGQGSDAARNRLMRQAAAAGVADRLYFLAPCPNPFAVMRQADLFVMPSWWEGCSNALLEAMACGLPIVLSDRAGCAHQLLGYGRYGLLVDPSDVDGLAAAMLAQAGDGALRPGEQAREFDLRHALARYERVVLDMLSPPAREAGPMGVGPGPRPALTR